MSLVKAINYECFCILEYQAKILMTNYLFLTAVILINQVLWCLLNQMRSTNFSAF